MNLKLSFILIIAIIMIPITVGADNSTIRSSKCIAVTNYSVSPAILMPGDTGFLTASIQNTDLSREITVDYVYFYAPEMKTYRQDYNHLGQLGPGASVDITFSFEAPLKVGIYYPEIWISTEGSKLRYPAVIRVDNSNLIQNVEIPTMIPLRGSTIINYEISNARRNRIENVQIIPDAESIQFDPEFFFISSMEPGETKNTTFEMTPYSLPGKKNISFKLSFRQGENTHLEKREFSVNIVDSSDIKLIIMESPKTLARGSPASVTLDVVNTGSNNVKSISVLPLSDDIDFQPSESYVGNLGPGEMYTTQFDLAPKNTNSSINISFKAIYKNNDIWHETPLKTTTIPMESLQSSTTTPAPYPVLLGICVIVVIIGGLFYRYKRNMRDNP